MTSIEKKQIWRKATFLCRCNNSPNILSFETRSFCKSCGYLVPVLTSIYTTKCPACNNFDSWECLGSPCLACQFASITFQNPFHSRYRILLDTWLPIPSDIESSSDNTESSGRQTMYTPSAISCIEHERIVEMRKKSINDSLDTIRTSSSIEQNQIVFEDLDILKRNLFNQDSYNTSSAASLTSLQYSVISDNKRRAEYKNNNDTYTLNSAYTTCRSEQMDADYSMFETTDIQTSTTCDAFSTREPLSPLHLNGIMGESGRRPISNKETRDTKGSTRKHRWPNGSSNKKQDKKTNSDGTKTQIIQQRKLNDFYIMR
jgi:hypothetical protein